MSETTRNVTSSPVSADGRSPCNSLDGVTDLFGQVHVLVDPSPSQASAKAMLTSVIFGQLGFRSFGSAVLQSCLENRLQVLLAASGNPDYVLTWKRLAMQSGPPICALRASVRPTFARVFGGWQTPTTRDGKGESGKGNRIRRGRNGRLHVANLCDQIVDLGRRDLVRFATIPVQSHGVPAVMGRCRAYGNAIVPQVAAAFVKAYLECW